MSKINEEQVIEVLKQCLDPEIPIDLWNLGLIYSIKINDAESGNSNVDITMTLTTPGCHMGSYMANDIKTKLEGLDSVDLATVQVVFDPVWTPDMMTDEARERLGFKKPPAEE
ncbi:MAG: DUF59 domain-containing protein [Candidatus Marinimicrobia bacterium]|nr:DUF59 domain-containing protein [Candidatus Neomarinimicrobiota bacterium]MBL7022820.1 DUF59 domain-containing protein [Candidatus Neomarinimicrobiota bacterium]MBL7109459.1 DUF59 domain-containing protein [Candidatus Neomarinimicrobiota bacterium]